MGDLVQQLNSPFVVVPRFESKRGKPFSFPRGRGQAFLGAEQKPDRGLWGQEREKRVQEGGSFPFIE